MHSHLFLGAVPEAMGRWWRERYEGVPLPGGPTSDHFKELKKLIFLLCAYHYTYSKDDEGKHWKNNSLSSPKSLDKRMPTGQTLTVS